jgi:hypothetical protein
MRQFAKYIDQNLMLLTKLTENGTLDAPEADADEDLFANLGRSIGDQQAELTKMEKQMIEIEELGDLMKNARSAIDELKRFGILCDLPIAIAACDDRRPFPSFEPKKVSARSPLPVRQPPKIPTKASEVQYREIEVAEYRSLPSIVPLLVKFEEMNKYYHSLVESGKLRFNSEELADLVPLSNSRLNAFTRALVSLQRLAAVEDSCVTYYHLL